MNPGIGFYVFDKKCNLLLVQKPKSTFGVKSKTDELYWLVPGTAKELDKLREAKTINEKQEIAKNDYLKKDIVFPDGFLGACRYVGRWLYTHEDASYFFDNFIITLNDLSKTISEKLQKQPGIGEIRFFNLFDLPAEGELSPLTAGFLKSLLFQSPSEIRGDVDSEQKNKFEQNIKEQGNRFLLYKKVQGGSYGAVYKVLDIPTLLPRAIKIAIPDTKDKKWRERLILEGTTLMRLRQLTPELDNSIERIFSIEQIDDDNEKYFLVKNWISGNTLEKEISDANGEILVDGLIVDIMKKIIKTLKAIHTLERPICHRDLKPNNIMISLNNEKNKTEKLILIDFGLCKNKEVHTGTEEEFHAGARIYQSVHTVNYYNEHNAIDDYYSSLQIFHWLLFGKHPYVIEWEEILTDKKSSKDTFLLAESSEFEVEGWPKSTKLFQSFFDLIKEYYIKEYYHKPISCVNDEAQKEYMEKIHNLFS